MYVYYGHIVVYIRFFRSRYQWKFKVHHYAQPMKFSDSALERSGKAPLATPPLRGSRLSQQGRLFMNMNLTFISMRKTMQLVAWSYIDCE